MRNRLAALPFALAAKSVTRYSPGRAGAEPLMMPVPVLSLSSFGSPATENRMGRSPVHGMRYRNGRPGRAPYTWGPLILGCSPGLGVRIGCSAEPAAATVNASTATTFGLLNGATAAPGEQGASRRMPPMHPNVGRSRTRVWREKYIPIRFWPDYIEFALGCWQEFSRTDWPSVRWRDLDPDRPTRRPRRGRRNRALAEKRQETRDRGEPPVVVPPRTTTAARL